MLVPDCSAGYRSWWLYPSHSKQCQLFRQFLAFKFTSYLMEVRLLLKKRFCSWFTHSKIIRRIGHHHTENSPEWVPGAIKHKKACNHVETTIAVHGKRLILMNPVHLKTRYWIRSAPFQWRMAVGSMEILIFEKMGGCMNERYNSVHTRTHKKNANYHCGQDWYLKASLIYCMY